MESIKFAQVLSDFVALPKAKVFSTHAENPVAKPP